ncbi:MAG: hypothetical protein ACK56I_34690, partial [bacterium]
VVVRQLCLFGEPLGQALEVEQLVRRVGRAQVHVGDQRQRVNTRAARLDRQHPFANHRVHQPVGDQPADHVVERQFSLR